MKSSYTPFFTIGSARQDFLCTVISLAPGLVNNDKLSFSLLSGFGFTSSRFILVVDEN